MSTNTLLFGVLFLLTATLVFLLIRIELRLQKLFKGTRAANLETLMAEIVNRVTTLAEESKKQGSDILTLGSRLQKHGRGVKLVRFNPFPEVGGNQSFAVGIVNEEGDGVVFSSLYSRERMSVFAKPIKKGASDIELTPEEASVVKDAQKEALE
jgi:hypothetical protein